MYKQDITGSIAHARMLEHISILSSEECTAIIDGLNDIMLDIESGQFAWSTELEDVHMNIEARLTDRIGITGKNYTRVVLETIRWRPIFVYIYGMK